MIAYPIEFNARTETVGGVANVWNSRAGEHQNQVAVPPEFDGPGGGFSPEDLYNQALTNCFVATFKVYCEHSKVTFENLEVDSRLVVDLDENKKPVMKDFFMTAHIHGASNPERAMMLAQRASKSGFILNSVKTNCHFEITAD